MGHPRRPRDRHARDAATFADAWRDEGVFNDRENVDRTSGATRGRWRRRDWNGLCSRSLDAGDLSMGPRGQIEPAMVDRERQWRQPTEIAANPISGRCL